MINNSRMDSYIIIMIMLLAKFFALLRDIFISKNYGITYIADAYNISYIVAITIFGFIGVAITNSLTPVLSKIYNNEKEKINLIISNIFTTLGLSSILITIICLVFSDKIVLVLGGGLDTSTLNLAIDLVEISIFSIIFLTLNSILNAILRVNNYFKTPVLGDLVLNFPCLLYLIFHHNCNFHLILLLLVHYLLYKHLIFHLIIDLFQLSMY